MAPAALTFTADVHPEWFKLTALLDGRAVGSVRAEARKYGGTRVMAVFDSKLDEAHRRQGVGTEMYRAANDVAGAEYQRPLASDTLRTYNADKLWESMRVRLRSFEVYDEDTGEDEMLDAYVMPRRRR